MANVKVEEQVLIDTANALREKLGNTKKELLPKGPPVETVISKSRNVIDKTHYGQYPSGLNDYDTITIPGAVRIKAVISVQTASFDWVQVCPGTKDQFNTGTDKITSKGINVINRTREFSGTDTITILFHTGTSKTWLGYYAEITGYDEAGNIVKYQPMEMQNVPLTFTPAEMALTIKNLKISYRLSTSSYSLSSGEAKWNINVSQDIPNWDTPFLLVGSFIYSGSYDQTFGVYFNGNRFETPFEIGGYQNGIDISQIRCSITENLIVSLIFPGQQITNNSSYHSGGAVVISLKN